MTHPFLENSKFEKIIDGKQTGLYFLKNHSGMQVAMTNYGARIVSLLVPSPGGELIDVVLGFDSIDQYLNSTQPYFGATIGRYGNRIADGQFTLDGKVYNLLKNNGPNSLHGGKKGFQDVVWDAKLIGDSTLELSYLSEDMEEGFPGNLRVKVTFLLTEDNQLKIDYEATTDKKTVLNLTNHAFFNLDGERNWTTIHNHLLTINADRYLPVNSDMIPTGEIASVTDTPFDFRTPVSIGKYIDAVHDQIKNGNGYDHTFVLNGSKNSLKLAATVRGERGVIMEVFTQEPGVQFYSGNFLQSKNILRGGDQDNFRIAFCLETQHFPDSPNQPDFPTTVLEPGEIYRTSSIYGFPPFI
ncbi:MAG: aldose epimerase family protein [Ginsengibacter sp.]